ncbi:MAG: hypothetical protein J5798_06290 [Spirochaetaceae bacterium]|nr:hypothetical protein [Spirochaetaceae bacterium]MBR4826045.1 hypothetical protein [Spirochaetaceae bacterium]
MSYEHVAEKLKALPEQALEEISHYVDYICTIYVKESEFEKQDKAHRLSLLSNLQKFRGRLPADFDADKELAQAREQKYS